jgi:erythritol kinase (D-erythritol 1-phosphate-forming)
MSETPLILALDSGTSMVKAVAFDSDGEIVAQTRRSNVYVSRRDGAVEQDMRTTWRDACAVLGELVPRLEGREIAGLAVTGQGDGTWLIDAENHPVAPAWLWLDARAAAIVEEKRGDGSARDAFTYTGTGLAACQQAPQLAWMQRHAPQVLARAACAMHCKDWLYLNLTGVRATDPSEGCFTFGDWRTRLYRHEVLRALGLVDCRHLLPDIVDGTTTHHALSRNSAAATGLPQGLPVVLGFVDVVCSALGAGAYGTGSEVGVTILGSTGMHLRLVTDNARVEPSPEMTGYCMVFPVPGCTLQAQSNMAATLNMDWLADLARDAAALSGAAPKSRVELLRAFDPAVAAARPGSVVFHPFISSSGERGPFTDAFARAGMFGIDQTVTLAGLARGVYEGLGLAARDCYTAAGGIPREVRVTGGAARAAPMRAILGACLGCPVRTVARQETGAAGAAMIAAVCVGLFSDMAACADRWVKPRLGAQEMPEPALASFYDALFPIYQDGYAMMPSLWRRLHAVREAGHVA